MSGKTEGPKRSVVREVTGQGGVFGDKDNQRRVDVKRKVYTEGRTLREVGTGVDRRRMASGGSTTFS